MGNTPVAGCTSVQCCCQSAEKSGGGNVAVVEATGIHRADRPPEVRLVAWFRRRSGTECDFGEIFEELFGGRDPIGESKFSSVLKERGVGAIDTKAVFKTIDRGRKGAISAEDMEVWQEGIEKKEIDGLRHWRDWLRKRYATPSAAFHAMGKGEGDTLAEHEFEESLARLGYDAEDGVELFQYIDKDFSGEVTFAEFKAAMRAVGVKRVKEQMAIKASRRSMKAISEPQSRVPSRQSRREDSDDSDGEPTRQESKKAGRRASLASGDGPNKRKSVKDAGSAESSSNVERRAGRKPTNQTSGDPAAEMDYRQPSKAEVSIEDDAADSEGGN